VGGFVQRSSVKDDDRRNETSWCKDEWKAFTYKFTPLEVIQMDVNHGAFDDENLKEWRRVILRKAGNYAHDLLLDAFPEEKSIPDKHKMSRSAVYVQYLQNEGKWVEDDGSGAWERDRERGDEHAPEGTRLGRVRPPPDASKGGSKGRGKGRAGGGSGSSSPGESF